MQKLNGKKFYQKFVDALGEEQHMQSEEKMKPDEHYGEVQVQIQVFKGIPLQVKLMDGTNEKRFGLPKNYVEAFKEAQLPGDNFVVQRKWMDWGIRYGDMDEIGQTVLEEVQAAYPQSRLDELVEQAKNPNIKKDQSIFVK